MELEKERKLVERAQNGDQEAYRRLVEDNQRKVYGFALRYTNRHEDADEIAQETFIRAHRGLNTFRGRSSFRTWLYRIAVNCCHNHKRKEKRTAADEEIEEIGASLTDRKNPSPLRRAMDTQTRSMIDEALDKLSKQQRAVFVMKYLQHHSVAEISEALGCAQGTVKKQLFRAVGRMRENLAPLLGIEG